MNSPFEEIALAARLSAAGVSSITPHAIYMTGHQSHLEDRTVGPSLGQDSIEASMKAGLYSMLCVVLSMLIIYKLSGVNALVGLMLNVLLLFGALAYFGATLTLPGRHYHSCPGSSR